MGLQSKLNNFIILLFIMTTRNKLTYVAFITTGQCCGEGRSHDQNCRCQRWHNKPCGTSAGFPSIPSGCLSEPHQQGTVLPPEGGTPVIKPSAPPTAQPTPARLSDEQGPHSINGGRCHLFFFPLSGHCCHLSKHRERPRDVSGIFSLSRPG